MTINSSLQVIKTPLKGIKDRKKMWKDIQGLKNQWRATQDQVNQWKVTNNLKNNQLIKDPALHHPRINLKLPHQEDILNHRGNLQALPCVRLYQWLSNHQIKQYLKVR